MQTHCRFGHIKLSSNLDVRMGAVNSGVRTGAMKADIKKTLEKIVREQFVGVQIDAVRVEPDTDYDGNDIFRVTIVFDAKNGLDAEKAKSLVRHMRAQLTKKADFAFPVVAFRSRADDKRLKAAAA